jgi:hypothetical protein
VSIVNVRDHVIWVSHVHGNDGLRERLAKLGEGEAVSLIVDGDAGTWIKMDNRPDGSPTPGVKPAGKAKRQWAKIYDARRGSVVDVIAAPGEPRPTREDER